MGEGVLWGLLYLSVLNASYILLIKHGGFDHAQ